MYIRCFTKTDDWEEWLAVKERLAISIKEIVEKIKPPLHFQVNQFMSKKMIAIFFLFFSC